ncbi:MAG: hypothetical protein IT314_01085 [Anaerolineales bacterium]|nr:hypothetical protein [Anaerolineales bacterium]
MKSKRLSQILVVFALLFSSFGGSQPAFASASAAPPQDPIVINRNLNIWDATFIGFVSAGIHEKWSLNLTEPHTFEVKASTAAGDLVPLLILFDSNNVELARATGALVTSQPTGSYFIQVQPESGAGFYFLTLRDIVSAQPSASTAVNPTSVNVGETATVTVNLNNVPAEGYTSAEFTCTFNASLVSVSSVVATNLFGADPAVAITAPQNGSFIVAIAGSNGSKAVTSGAAFSFTVTALQAGQTAVECVARVSQGNNVLTTLPSTPAALTVNGGGATPTSTPVESPTATNTSAPGETPTATSTSAPGETPTATSTSTPVESPTPTLTSTSEASPTPSPTPLPTFTSTPEASPTPLPDGILTGQVIASKPVTVGLYTGNTLVTSVTANPDGAFSLTAPAGSYTVLAIASGFLSAQGSAALTPGGTTNKPNVTLLAGDIDGNNVIDQFDALTIGINYNSASPAAADLNNDSVINVLDLERLAQNYRDTGPTVWE